MMTTDDWEQRIAALWAAIDDHEPESSAPRSSRSLADYARELSSSPATDRASRSAS